MHDYTCVPGIAGKSHLCHAYSILVFFRLPFGLFWFCFLVLLVLVLVLVLYPTLFGWSEESITRHGPSTEIPPIRLFPSSRRLQLVSTCISSIFIHSFISLALSLSRNVWFTWYVRWSLLLTLLLLTPANSLSPTLPGQSQVVHRLRFPQILQRREYAQCQCQCQCCGPAQKNQRCVSCVSCLYAERADPD